MNDSVLSNKVTYIGTHEQTYPYFLEATQMSTRRQCRSANTALVIRCMCSLVEPIMMKTAAFGIMYFSIGDDYSASKSDKSAKSAVIMRTERGKKINDSISEYFDVFKRTEEVLVQEQKN